MDSSVSLRVQAVFFGILASATAQTTPADPNHALIQRYCIGCHNNSLKTAGVTFQGLDLTNIGGNAELLERILRKVKTGQMPPPGMPHPAPAVMGAFQQWLESSLDAESAAHPDPGRASIHRLNRAEYSNAVRDVLGLDVHPGEMLPVDDSGYGFDNNGDVLSMSPALLDRYLTVARKLSRLAIGDPTIKPVEEAFETRRSGRNNPVPQRLEWVSDDLPFDSAGGVSVHYYFPLDAEYVLRVKFGDPSSPATPKPIELRLPIQAGMRTVGVTFPRESLLPELSALPARKPEPREVAIDIRLDGASLKRTVTTGVANALPRIMNFSIAGPYNTTGPGDTLSRRKILVCHPASAADESGCAAKILASLTRHAYRRPTTTTDIAPLLAFYQQARRKGGFEYGIQKAVEAILISPDFLFRVEADVHSKAAGPMHPVAGLDLASRLSFFLWSSVPDDQLLDLAVNGKLSDPNVLRQQVARMLDDPKSSALTTNFAGQWFYLRNLAAVKPDPAIFGDWDESLRFSMERETELFFDSILRENRSALDLLRADYTFLNERLAKHYGIPGIYGSQFRRVSLSDPNRGGLLGQGSLLTVTSPPNRTSVVKRGKWVLDNLLGAPPPPPPPVPALEETTKGHQTLSLRAALELHRADPGCASCHKLMDPIGFSLENYNGIGQWRTKDGSAEIDASGKLPDGTEFNGPAGLKKALTTVRSEQFASAVVERLLTYALGRGVEYYDEPVVRAIVRETSPGEFRMRDVITAIVLSRPFQMRRSADQ